jgi:hypothetical protein
MSWADAAKKARQLTGPHFVLTDRAVGMLDANPYPDAARMLDHLRRLSDLARRYHDAEGDLGGPITDIARSEHEIHIALTDKGLRPPKLAGFDGLQAEPHVKVDDYKSPDQCGRIYFAVDKERFRFIIDHVGLHSYG